MSFRAINWEAGNAGLHALRVRNQQLELLGLHAHSESRQGEMPVSPPDSRTWIQ